MWTLSARLKLPLTTEILGQRSHLEHIRKQSWQRPEAAAAPYTPHTSHARTSAIRSRCWEAAVELRDMGRLS